MLEPIALALFDSDRGMQGEAGKGGAQGLWDEGSHPRCHPPDALQRALRIVALGNAALDGGGPEEWEEGLLGFVLLL